MGQHVRRDTGHDQSPTPVPGQRKIWKMVTWRGESGWVEFHITSFQARALLPRCKSLSWLLLSAMGLHFMLCGEAGSGLAPTAMKCRCCCPCSVWRAKLGAQEDVTLSEGPTMWGLLANVASLDFTFRMTVFSPFCQIHLFYLQSG